MIHVYRQYALYTTTTDQTENRSQHLVILTYDGSKDASALILCFVTSQGSERPDLNGSVGGERWWRLDLNQRFGIGTDPEEHKVGIALLGRRQNLAHDTLRHAEHLHRGLIDHRDWDGQWHIRSLHGREQDCFKSNTFAVLG